MRQHFDREKRDWNAYNETYLTLLVTIINKQLFKKNIRLKENQYNRKRKGKCVVLKIYDFFIFENYNAKKYGKSHFNIVLCFTLILHYLSLSHYIKVTRSSFVADFSYIPSMQNLLRKLRSILCLYFYHIVNPERVTCLFVYHFSVVDFKMFSFIGIQKPAKNESAIPFFLNTSQVLGCKISVNDTIK